MQFVVNKHAAELATTPVNSPTDTLRVSTPEVTSLDLANRPNGSGGLSNVATVIIELFEDREVVEQGLIDGAHFYPSASVRRAGYLLETFADARLDSLRAFADPAAHEPAPLQAGGVRRGRVDPRWNLRVNTEIEPDL
jgi:predicted transcriptional regulator of viral defense system